MKDKLISCETAIRQTMGKLDYVDTIFDKPTESEIVYMLRSLPSVPAIPIDKLCEWLTETKMPLANACPLIEECHVCLQCDFFHRPIKECWKEILSKLMEEQQS